MVLNVSVWPNVTDSAVEALCENCSSRTRTILRSHIRAGPDILCGPSDDYVQVVPAPSPPRPRPHHLRRSCPHHRRSARPCPLVRLRKSFTVALFMIAPLARTYTRSGASSKTISWDPHGSGPRDRLVHPFHCRRHRRQASSTTVSTLTRPAALLPQASLLKTLRPPPAPTAGTTSESRSTSPTGQSCPSFARLVATSRGPSHGPRDGVQRHTGRCPVRAVGWTPSLHDHPYHHRRRHPLRHRHRRSAHAIATLPPSPPRPTPLPPILLVTASR